ncbi:MAG: response regulator, partial [Pseudomonadota bacterium]
AAPSVEHLSIAEGVNHGVDSADALTAPVSPATSDTEARESASLRDGNEPEGALEAAPTAGSTSDSILRFENDAPQPASPVAATSADVEDVLPEEATTDTISQVLEGRHSDVVTVGDNTGDDSGSVESSSLKEDVDANTDSPLGAVDDTETTAIVGVLAEVPSLPDAEDKEDIFEGFGDDIFADDLLETASAHEQSDIDALFDDLSLGAEEPDAICGLGMEEFPVDSESDCLEADSVVGEVENAAQEFEPAPEYDQLSTVSSDDASQATDPEPDSALQAVAQQSSGSGVVDGEFNCIPDGIIFSDASPGGGDIFADFLEAFVEEGSSEIEKLEDAVAAWERDVASEDAFAVVGRVLHTIKGIAKGVGLHYYGTLVHNFETLLGAMARPEAGLESDYFRIVNAWLDACVRGLDHIQDARSDIPYVLPQTRTQAQTAATTSLEAGDAPEAIQIQTQSQDSESQREAKRERVDDKARKQSKKIADDGAKVLAAQQSIRITSEKLDDMLNLSNEAQQLGVRTAQSVNRGKRASMEMQHRLGSLRSHISAIADRALRSVAARGVKQDASMDALEMDQYSELQEAANILREGVEDLADLVDFANRQNAQIEALLKHQANVISSIGSSIRAARVVPVSRLMPGLRRLVRTVSVDLNKTVNFQVLNEIGTLDRDDYARCQTILDHMVRNALDHGIETATQRKDAGKPEEGLITIDIRKAGADSIITLSDDGRGIDPQKMRESAVAKGLEIDVESLTDDEAAQLIFHKGFSTAGSVSQISGRGVGMDIVLTELQEMGGDIQINSEPGKGTSFDIRVPSSITVNGALLVSAGEQSYAIPLGGLIGVEQVPVEEFFAAVQGNTLLSVAGLDCEPAYLATLCRTGHSLDAKTWRTSVPVVVAGSDERRMAIAVDDVEEALELVIRSLGAQFADVPGVAGAATTAAGEAIVALDLNLLVDSVGEDDRSPLHVGAEREEALTVMVVDDSRTQRMVATSQLETVGVATVTAENGSVAIDLLNSADRLPDIILMDVEMPVKDGIQALREIRKSVRYGHVPVIMVTSRTGLKHRAMAQAAGCNGYMGKPFNFRMLIGQINELTGHRLQLS